MSVKELFLTDEETNIQIRMEGSDLCFYLTDDDGLYGFRLDRNQADMLRLYLTEHLK